MANTSAFVTSVPHKITVTTPKVAPTTTKTSAMLHKATTTTLNIHNAIHKFAVHISLKSVAMFTMLLILMALIGLWLYKRGGTTKVITKIPSIRSLSESFTSPSVDSVGLILDLDSGAAKLLPLRKVENLYFPTSPTTNPAIVISVPNAPVWHIDGKPLVIAVASGEIGIQADVQSLASLGLAKIAIEDELWDDTMEPRKSYEKLIERLATITSDKIGRIPISPGTKLAFQVSPPRVALAMLRHGLMNTSALSTTLVSLSQTIDQVVNALRRMGAEEYYAKSRWLATLFTGIAMIMIVGGLVWFLWMRMHHP